MRKIGGKKGFTLVELSLAVGFIGLLSLTITLIINDTVATYRRGLTLNQVNTTGMDLVDDFRSAIQNSPAREPSVECASMFAGDINNANSIARACQEDGASSLVHMERTAMVNIPDGNGFKDVGPVPIYGVICTGAFSYIWNSGYFFGENAGGAVANTSETHRAIAPGIDMATFDDGTGEKTFRLLKIKDEKRGLCKNVLRTVISETGEGDKLDRYYKSIDFYNGIVELPHDFSTTVASVNADYFDGFDFNRDAEIVLADNATNPLALYDFTITAPVANTDGESSFYSASFVLGTLTGGINVKAMGNFCKTPEDYNEDFDYCAINKFNFAAQAKGG